jgi:hypothetical protein
MTRDQLRLQLAAAVERHARTLQDHDGRAGPALLDDLEQVAEEHARQHAERVTARRELREEAAAPFELVAAASHLAAADPQAATGGNGKPDPEAPVTGGSAGSARTRTRTRGGPK